MYEVPKFTNKELKLTMAQRLKEYRIACGLTQQQIADILNINRTTYTKYETGISEPSHDLLKRIISIFGVDYNAILSDEDNFQRNVYDSKLPVYNLTKNESKLIAGFRTLGEDGKKELLKNMTDLLAKNE